jgi:REP element-mobilizing transposase RayT
MARNKRIWDPEYFSHIVSRGNRRDALFYDEDDFKIFLHILQKINEKYPFELASYCLMTNHYHLLLRSADQSFSKVMALVNKRYADYYNTKYNLTGHVFEKRFFDKITASAVDLLEVSRYIHMNPVEAGMVLRPEDYRWSSYRYYRYYRNTEKNPLLNKDAILVNFPGNKAEKRRKYEEYMTASRKGEADYLIDASK